MPKIELTINPESYNDVEGLVSLLKQNCISAETVGFPLQFTVNCSWDEETIQQAINEIYDYEVLFDVFDEEIWTIKKL
jgi:hypothetical protein